MSDWGTAEENAAVGQGEDVGGLHKYGDSGMNDRTKVRKIRRQDLVIARKRRWKRRC